MKLSFKIPTPIEQQPWLEITALRYYHCLPNFWITFRDKFLTINFLCIKTRSIDK